MKLKNIALIMGIAVSGVVVNGAFSLANAFTISGAWSYESASEYAGTITFRGVKNLTNKDAYDFHVTFDPNDGTGKVKTHNFDPFLPAQTSSGKAFVYPEGTLKEINLVITQTTNDKSHFSAYWTDKDHREIPIPEPLTILGSITALGFGGFLKRKLGKSQNT